MSYLSRVNEFLESKCLCHAGSNLNYALESLPNSIHQPIVKFGCDCRHGQEKDIKRALRQFKTFLQTKARFKVGDRVELAITPDINEHDSWGWMGSKHFLVEGARATIRDVSYRCDFGYSLIFDEESWIDRDEVIHPVKDKSNYYFEEKDIRPISNISTRAFLKQLWHDFSRIGD